MKTRLESGHRTPGESDPGEAISGAPSRGLRSSGPGWLVAAAFIGPGTVTTATVAGAEYGVVLVWALLFSVLATMVLQEMAARLGLVTGLGLGEAVRRRFTRPLLRIGAIVLIVSAIALGNAAYETGNLLGGSLGVAGLVGGEPRLWAVVIGVAGFVLLWTGSYRLLERVLIGMVVLMSVVFVGTALTVLPALPELARGLFRPTIPDGALLVAIGLIGTTVVPYNLFLHASTVREKWSGPESLGDARRNLVLSIGVGGIVSMAILVTAAGTIHQAGGEVAGAPDMARQLEPLLGRWAGVFFAAGFFAAGMTSSITAPLAAAYATAGALGWERDLRSPRFRMVWGGVLGAGMLMAVTGIRPIEAIIFAQAANGLLLPAIAFFLLLAVNDRRWMGDRVNSSISNAIGVFFVLVALALGMRALLSAVGVL
jgi:manganese transport protein